MHYLRKIHKVTTLKEVVSVGLPTRVFSKITERILMKIRIWSLQQNLLGEFNLLSYRSNITSTSHVNRTRLYRFSQKRLMERKIDA